MILQFTIKQLGKRKLSTNNITRKAFSNKTILKEKIIKI